jgi:hypothetical protein
VTGYKFGPIDPVTFLPPAKVVDALSDVIADRVGSAPGAGATVGDVAEAVTTHVNDTTPHPVYDDAPSYEMFYTARKAAAS